MMTTIAVQRNPLSQEQAPREAAIQWVSVYGDEVTQPTGAVRFTERSGATARPTPEDLIQWVSVRGDE
jgi:hypothetical protein